MTQAQTVHTKEGRLQSRKYQFDKLIEAGYVQETYKGLDFFTLNDGKYFTLKVFRGNAANHCEYVNYRTEERRAEVISNYKSGYDRNEAYKAEQKEKYKGRKSSHAGAAAAIKAELQNKFPGIKFSCTSDSFSMGDSVDIRWTDGPTTTEVKAISAKYQYGHFNGMEDIYEYTNSREDIPQSKYVSENRKMSDEVSQLATVLKDKFSGMFENADYHNTPDRVLYRIFCNTSLPAGAIIKGIERTATTCGHLEEFFYIVLELPEATEQAAEPLPVEPGKLQFVDYSEKAFAVVGDTKPVKDKLKELGGSFNFRLTCGAGWIFPKTKFETVKAAFTI